MDGFIEWLALLPIVIELAYQAMHLPRNITTKPDPEQ